MELNICLLKEDLIEGGWIIFSDMESEPLQFSMVYRASGLLEDETGTLIYFLCINYVDFSHC